MAIGLASVVGYYEVNVNRRWRTDANMLNDDRRRPIIWVNTAIGLVYDCFSALHTDTDDYEPELTTDYRLFRDMSKMYQTPTIDDPDLEHYWASPNL